MGFFQNAITAHALAKKLLEGPDVPVVIPRISEGYTGVVEGLGDCQNVLDLDEDEETAVVSLAFEETDLETDFDSDGDDD
jgi:hypothetical protein